MKLFFEELDKVEELGAFADFCEAASPWVAIGTAVAVGIVAFT